jgi:shikimate kinase
MRGAFHPRIALVGFMGCGKSAVGRRLARRLRREWVDSDSLIERREGMPVPELFKARGEAAFREIESGVLSSLSAREGIVLSCGGGAILADENRRLLRESFFTIWLRVGAEAALARIEPGSRPLLDCENPAQVAGLLLERRLPLYAEVARLSVDTEIGGPDQVTEALYAMLDQAL